MATAFQMTYRNHEALILGIMMRPRGLNLGFSTGFIYSSTSESTFSTDYSDDGFEISITRLFSLLTSGAVAFIIPILVSLPLLMKKRTRFKIIRKELEEDLFGTS